VTKLVRDHCEATMEVASFQGGFVADPPPNSTDVPEPSGIGWIFALASLLFMSRSYLISFPREKGASGLRPLFYSGRRAANNRRPSRKLSMDENLLN